MRVKEWLQTAHACELIANAKWSSVGDTMHCIDYLLWNQFFLFPSFACLVVISLSLSCAWNVLNVFFFYMKHFAWKTFVSISSYDVSVQYNYDIQTTCVITNQTMAEKRNKSFQGKLRCHLSVCTLKVVLGELVLARARHELDNCRT